MTTRPPAIQRVALVVTDGLRPDAIEEFGLSHFGRLLRHGAGTLSAQTVSPSVTSAAMTSLFTGVYPAEHGIRGNQFGLPTGVRSLRPLARVLAECELPTVGYLARLPTAYLWIARQIATVAGAREAHFLGDGADSILRAAGPYLARSWTGLLFFHWPDTDRVGHATGWMSADYGRAARKVDAALGELAATLRIGIDPSTLLIVLSDHGGGGERIDDHESDQPADTTIPIVLAGSAVRATQLHADTHLLDIPATILWALGVPAPPEYAGRPLLEAFHRERLPGATLEAMLSA